MLIVDDERMIREGIKAALPWKDIGINEVLLASSGEEALEIMKHNDVDIIITEEKTLIINEKNNCNN